MAQFRQTYTNDGGGSLYNQNTRAGYGLPPKAGYETDLAGSYRNNLANADTTTKNNDSTSKYNTPNGSISTAVVAGRADPVPQSNVNTTNSYYTVYDGTNRTAIDSKTGQAVGNAQGAYNPPSDSGNNGGNSGQTETPSYSLPSSVGGSNSDANKDNWYNKVDELMAKLQGYLSDYEANSKTAYGAQRDEEYAQNKNSWRDSGDQINLNKARAERYMNALNGPNPSGTGYRNNTAINLQWAKDHNANNRNLDTLNANTLSKYNTNLANLNTQLAQANANMVLPVYTNRIAQLDQLQQQEKLNQMDYDYRRYLASMGMM